MRVEVPLSRDELLDLKTRAEEFLRMCGKYDSTGRVYAWSSFHANLGSLLREEDIHNFEFPSPGNPEKDKILEELDKL